MKIVAPWLLGLISAASLSAAEISATGAWFETITAADLTGGAGSDLRSPVDSAAGTTVLTVTAAGAWQLKARYAGGSWPAGMTVWVRRVSNGTGSGTISGGEAFVPLGASDTDFFSGSDNRGSISIQFRVTGLNVSVTPGNYSCPITFSVH